MIVLSDYDFSTRHHIYRDICLLFLGEPTVVPFSRALLSRTLNNAQNFRRHNPNSKLTSLAASISFLAAVIFCVIVWQKTALPAPNETWAITPTLNSQPTATAAATRSALPSRLDSTASTRSSIRTNQSN